MEKVYGSNRYKFSQRFFSRIMPFFFKYRGRSFLVFNQNYFTFLASKRNLFHSTWTIEWDWTLLKRVPQIYNIRKQLAAIYYPDLRYWNHIFRQIPVETIWPSRSRFGCSSNNTLMSLFFLFFLLPLAMLLARYP